MVPIWTQLLTKAVGIYNGFEIVNTERSSSIIFQLFIGSIPCFLCSAITYKNIKQVKFAKFNGNTTCFLYNGI